MSNWAIGLREVAVSLGFQLAGAIYKGVIDVLRCSRCKVLFKGSGGIAIL